ncbi:MAG: S8 family serine peptidase [Candidatus Heimdallarchaeota archaeon]|nr:S8 family serine peptidase [Candidatus Heimdallarchaeota archaeon]
MSETKASRSLMSSAENGLEFMTSGEAGGIPLSILPGDTMGAQQAIDAYGYEGEGVIVNVDDTGVDFGSPSLSAAMAVDASGHSQSFDGSGSIIALTTLWSGYAAAHIDANKFVTFANLDLDYTFNLPGLGLFTPAEIGITIPDKWYVGDLAGDTTGFHFGIAAVGDTVGKGLIFVPFLMADVNNDGDFDSLYFDWETGVAITTLFNGDIRQADYDADAKFNFSSSIIYSNTGNNILAMDLFGRGDSGPDGYNDISVGALSNTFDILNYSGSFGTSDPIVRGIHPAGEVFAYMADDNSHGTAVAGNIAGRPTNYNLLLNDSLYEFKGLAPKSTIIATKGLSAIGGYYNMLWTTGYEPDVNGEWKFVNTHIANISNFSWGSTSFSSAGYAGGFGFDDMFYEIISIPGYVNANHPGKLHVFSAGNSGSGYGTTSSPVNPTNLLAGASTNWWSFSNGGISMSLLFTGGSNQGDGQLASFSSSGPDNLGFSVDILGIGMWGWSASPVVPHPEYLPYFTGELFEGVGGIGSFHLHGGTSQAAPMVVGVLALMYSAYAGFIGGNLAPDAAKTILKSSAKDLGYDMFSQGAGQANAKKAIDTILNAGGVTTFDVTSKDAYNRAGELLSPAFLRYFGLNGQIETTIDGWVNDTVSQPHPSNSIDFNDTFFFSGAIMNGSSYTASFETNAVYDNLEALKFQTTYTHETTEWTTAADRTFVHLFSNFDETAIKSAEFLEFSMLGDYDQFLNDFSVGDRFGVWLINHDDLNNDGVVDDNEVIILGNAFNFYNTATAYFSTEAFSNNTWAIVMDGEIRDSGATEGNDFKFSIRAFTRVPDAAMSFVQSGTAFSATVDTTGLSPGRYQGFIKVSSADGGQTLVPYTYSVVLDVGDYGTDGWATISGLTDRPYDNSVGSHVDWGGSQTSGDWRSYQIYIKDVSANSLGIEIEWSLAGTVIDAYILDSTGFVVLQSDLEQLENGHYISIPSAPDTIQRLLANITDYGAEVFTLVLHATVYNNTAGAQTPFTVRATTVTETVSAFAEPVATISTSKPTVFAALENYTDDVLGISWTTVSGNPIPSFTNVGLRTDLSVSAFQEIKDEGVMLASELVPNQGSIIIPERVYPISLIEGQIVEGFLEWDNKITDMDLLLIPAGSAYAFANDLFGTASTLANPEKATALIPVTGQYEIVIEYFSGDGTDQPYNLEVVAKSSLVDVASMNAADLQLSLLAEGVPDGSYLVESTSYGWNNKFTIAESIAFDGNAPSITDLVESIRQDATSGDVRVGTIFEGNEYDYTVTKAGTTIGSGTGLIGTNQIIVNAAQITGLLESNSLVVTVTDEFDHVSTESFSVFRRDDSPPVVVGPDDQQLTVGTHSLSWTITDETDGTYELVVGSQEFGGDYVSGEAFSISILFAEEGLVSLFFKGIDSSGNAKRLKTVIEVLPAPATTTTTSETSDDGGDDGFLPLGILPVLVSMIITAQLIRRKIRK